MNCTNDNDVHNFEEEGGGTALKYGLPDYSDVSYQCTECKMRLVLYLPADTYIRRKYPRKMLLEICESGTVATIKAKTDE